MKRNFILVFILLVTLSTVNAIPHQLLRRVTTFQPCPDGQGAPLNVIVTPDPPKAGDTAAFDVSGTANEVINNDAVLAIGFVNLSSDPPTLVGEPFTQQICSGNVKCPVQSGTSFEAKAEQVPVPKVSEPFGIIVAVGSPESKTPSNCALAVVGGSGGSPGGGSGGGGSGGSPGGGGSGGSGSPDGSPGGPPPSSGGSPGGGPGGPTFLMGIFV